MKRWRVWLVWWRESTSSATWEQESRKLATVAFYTGTGYVNTSLFTVAQGGSTFCFLLWHMVSKSTFTLSQGRSTIRFHWQGGRGWTFVFTLAQDGSTFFFYTGTGTSTFYFLHWHRVDQLLAFWWLRELTLKCLLKCSANQWKSYWASALVRKIGDRTSQRQETSDLGANQTHDLQIWPSVCSTDWAVRPDESKYLFSMVQGG